MQKKYVVKEVTLSLSTDQYAAGDVLAATQAVSAAFRSPGMGGRIKSLVVLDKDDKAGDLDVVFLKTNVSIGTENAAVSVTDANADEVVGVVEVVEADYVDLVNSQIAVKELDIVVEAPADSDDLYVAAISRDTDTYTASGITLKIGLIQD